jgi:signal transduction histidine kinase
VRWQVAALLLLAYLLADSVTELFPHPRFGVQPWNLHPALAVALLAAGGQRWLPLVALAVLGRGALVPGASLGGAWLLAGLAVSACYGLAAAGLHRWTRWGERAVRPQDVNALLAVALPTAIACAAIDATRQILEPGLDASAYPVLTWRLWIADLLGLVVWTPLLLQALGRAWAPARAAVLGLLRDLALFLLVLGALLYLVFGFAPLDQFRMSYLLFLPMVAVAMRHGLFGVVSLLPALQLGLLGALATIGTRPGTAFEFQLLILTLAISALYLGALTDERRRAAERIAAHERTLRERSRALDEAQRVAATAELAAALAHDLSQPLSAIGTYARASQVLAGRGIADRPQLLETLDQIAGETARAGQYLKRMREFFRTGSMHIERVPVTRLIESTHAHLRDRLVQAEASWTAHVDPGLSDLRIDAVQTGAVLGNLVVNACDALGGHCAVREIHVHAQAAVIDGTPCVRIRVEDTGPGVAAELRERLFRPLATSKPQGMGLGLALSRSIAERQGGRLWFDASRTLTTFCLDLPCYA